MSLTSYAVQLLSWGMGSAMATYLPNRSFNTFGDQWSLNLGPWNAKEHALIVVSCWGSVSTGAVFLQLSANSSKVLYRVRPRPSLCIGTLLRQKIDACVGNSISHHYTNDWIWLRWFVSGHTCSSAADVLPRCST